jgi:Ca2+-binding EF-hand superfamily protein
MDPSKLSASEMARVLSLAGEPVTEQQIKADIEAGAPQNADGTINLVSYVAWLVKELRNAS